MDRTPHGDTEFARPGDQGEQNRMDLLTVLEHEVGHLLGREAGACGVTLADLATGTRQTVHPVAGPGGVVSGVDLTGVEWVGNRK